MARTIEQNTADLEIAIMRMNQARDKLADAVIAGDEAEMTRLEKVHAAAIWDFRDLRAERRYMERFAAEPPPPRPGPAPGQHRRKE